MTIPLRGSEISVDEVAGLPAQTADWVNHSQNAVCVTHEAVRCTLELMRHVQDTFSRTEALLAEADRRLSEWQHSSYLWKAVARSGED